MSPQVSTGFDTNRRKPPRWMAKAEKPEKIPETRDFWEENRFTGRGKHDMMKTSV